MTRYLKQYKFLLFLTVLFTAISSLSYVFIAILLQQVMDIVDIGDMDGFIRIMLFSLLSPRDAYRLMLKDYPDVMDIGQMCEALGVSTKTGYKLLKDGKIEYLKIGRAYRIPKAHILRYLKITCSTLAE